MSVRKVQYKKSGVRTRVVLLSRQQSSIKCVCLVEFAVCYSELFVRRLIRSSVSCDHQLNLETK
jgi:hypothetical protein